MPCTFLDIFIILFLFIVTGYADLMHMFSYNYLLIAEVVAMLDERIEEGLNYR